MLGEFRFRINGADKTGKRIQQPEIVDIFIRLKGNGNFNLIFFKRGNFEGFVQIREKRGHDSTPLEVIILTSHNIYYVN